jgi:hypothetical protein
MPARRGKWNGGFSIKPKPLGGNDPWSSRLWSLLDRRPVCLVERRLSLYRHSLGLKVNR